MTKDEELVVLHGGNNGEINFAPAERIPAD